jgi:hypothetical protein
MITISRLNLLDIADQIRSSGDPHKELVQLRKQEGYDIATAVSKLLTAWGVQVDPRT